MSVIKKSTRLTHVITVAITIGFISFVVQSIGRGNANASLNPCRQN